MSVYLSMCVCNLFLNFDILFLQICAPGISKKSQCWHLCVTWRISFFPTILEMYIRGLNEDHCSAAWRFLPWPFCWAKHPEEDGLTWKSKGATIPPTKLTAVPPGKLSGLRVLCCLLAAGSRWPGSRQMLLSHSARPKCVFFLDFYFKVDSFFAWVIH